MDGWMDEGRQDAGVQMLACGRSGRPRRKMLRSWHRNHFARAFHTARTALAVFWREQRSTLLRYTLHNAALLQLPPGNTSIAYYPRDGDCQQLHITIA